MNRIAGLCRRTAPLPGRTQILAMVFALALSACGGSGHDTGPQTSATESQTPATGQQTSAAPPDARTPARPVASTNIAIEPQAGGRVWVVNQDNDSVSVIDPASRARLAEIVVGTAPRTIAIARNGQVWVANRDSATLSRIDPDTLSIAQTVALPPASQPFAIVESPADGSLWVSLQARGEVVSLDPADGAIRSRLALGPNIRHLSLPASGDRLLVSRFITPPLPDEATETPKSTIGGQPVGGELIQIDPVTATVLATTTLQASIQDDTQVSARGIPNYLGAAVISPDGKEAWVPSKQDNIFRGSGRRRPGSSESEPPLDFESTVRAITSRIALDGSRGDDLLRRVDHDNASLTSAAVYDPNGIFVIAALETSRELALIDPLYGIEVAMPAGERLATGRAPQGLAISADGKLLAVNNFMDRTVGLYDLGQLTAFYPAIIHHIADVPAIGAEQLAADVLRGKQLFHDARDSRLARDRYMSCASCHNDGGHDGRVWDFTSFDGVTLAEGLRNTISLRGRGQHRRLLHWTGNFDEGEDFEGQIRTFAGGSGLLSNEAFASGTVSQTLGDRKGDLPGHLQSADLTALAAYMTSLDAHDASPWRNADRSLTDAALHGRSLFQSKGCSNCHAGEHFAATDADLLQRRRYIGTTRETSGARLGQPLTGTNAGINVPTLRDVWATAPYLHDGSAATLGDAIDAHYLYDLPQLPGGAPTTVERAALVEYLRQIGGEEAGI